MTPLSAVQIMFSGLQGNTGKIDPERFCRVCGGPLLLPFKPLKDVSKFWTDENLCRRKDS